VAALAEASGDHRALVLTLAYTGIRWGEAIALRVRDIEFLRRRLAVHQNAVQLSSNHAVGPTKGRRVRSVPVPEFVLNELPIHRYTPVEATVEVRDSDEGYLQQVRLLALDTVNQGGVTALQLIKSSAN
jgi:hypothetical protein